MRGFRFQVTGFRLPAPATVRRARKISGVWLPALGIFSLPSAASACATCFGGNIDSPVTTGMNWAILTLGICISTVLAAFLAFLIYAIRKSEAVNAAAAAPKSTISNL